MGTAKQKEAPPFLVGVPTPQQLIDERLGAWLTTTAMAEALDIDEYVYGWEYGTRKMPEELWARWLALTGKHPHWQVTRMPDGRKPWQLAPR